MPAEPDRHIYDTRATTVVPSRRRAVETPGPFWEINDKDKQQLTSESRAGYASGMSDPTTCPTHCYGIAPHGREGSRGAAPRKGRLGEPARGRRLPRNAWLCYTSPSPRD